MCAKFEKLLQLIISSEAEEEISAVISWYEARRDGLGLEFFGNLERIYRQIVDFPYSFQTWPNDERYRRATLSRFPYIVLFEPKVETIEVVAVAHTSRSPGYWRLRLLDKPR